MDWGWLIPLSRESYYAEKSTDLLQVTDKLYPLKLYRSHIAMSKNRTHNFSCGKHNGTGRCTSNCRTIASTTSPSYDRSHYVSLVRSHPLRLPRTIAATTSPSYDRSHYVSLVRSHPLRLPRTIAATTSPSYDRSHYVSLVRSQPLRLPRIVLI